MKRIFRYILLLIVLPALPAKAQQAVDTVHYICPGDTFHLTAYSAGAVTYRWFLNDMLLPETGNVLTVTRFGAYSVAGVGEGNCISNRSRYILVEPRNPVAIMDVGVVPPGRSVTLDLLANDKPGCAPFVDSTLAITRRPREGTLNINPDGTVSYYANTNAQGVDSFFYHVTDTNGLITNQATVYVRIDLECAVLYPNPVSDKLYIKLKNIHIRQLRLTDAAGRILYESQVSKLVESIDMTAFSEGAYFVNFYDEKGHSLCSYKIINKQKQH